MRGSVNTFVSQSVRLATRPTTVALLDRVLLVHMSAKVLLDGADDLCWAWSCVRIFIRRYGSQRLAGPTSWLSNRTF